jgi:hypothetical protein
MSFIKHRSTRVVLPCLVIAAVLAFVTSALPASAATTRPGATGTCDTTPVFFGLHGMAEGPSNENGSGQIHTISPELLSFDDDQNAISGAVLIAPVGYPTVYASAWDVLDTIHLGPLTKAVNDAESALQTDITGYSKGCSVFQDKIALVGYSMGAWAINKWIEDHPLEWPMIKAVVLYGDPCLANGKDEGLVREYAGSYGCMPAKDYPYPLPGGTTAVPFAVQSWTAYRDPVSGANWAGQKSTQLKAAENCTNPKTCSHLDYTGSIAIKDGAQFVVSTLVG